MDVITLEMTNEKIKEYCHVIRNPADEIPDYVQDGLEHEQWLKIH